MPASGVAIKSPEDIGAFSLDNNKLLLESDIP